MKIAVVGTGHVGLVVGTGLADTGHNVTCVDIDPAKIEALNKGHIPFYEPGLEELVTRNIEEERLHFSTTIESVVPNVLLVFICVGTPSLPNGDADTAMVFKAVEQVGKAMSGYCILVIKSTCPVGTSVEIRDRLSKLTQHPFDIVVNPEFLRQGAAVDDFMRPDSIVVGCEDVRAMEIMKELYAPFLRTGKPILCMSPASAEMSKYAVNCMLATRISLMNELSGICEAYGANITEVRECLSADVRIGPQYLFPGLGFGGSCLPKDLIACARLASAKSLPSQIVDAVSHVNADQLNRFIKRILEYYGPAIRDKKIALWGASFKPKTDDLRGGPALRVVDALLNAGASVAAYDPEAGPNLRKHYKDRIAVASKSYSVLEDADGLIIATEWNEFRRPDYERMAKLMRERVIFDGRNLYTAKSLREFDFKYFSIGRGEN